jgi:hypothetical protein
VRGAPPQISRDMADLLARLEPAGSAPLEILMVRLFSAFIINCRLTRAELRQVTTETGLPRAKAAGVVPMTSTDAETCVPRACCCVYTVT